eukprot:515895-Amphidinium_carterae.1
MHFAICFGRTLTKTNFDRNKSGMSLRTMNLLCLQPSNTYQSQRAEWHEWHIEKSGHFCNKRSPLARSQDCNPIRASLVTEDGRDKSWREPYGLAFVTGRSRCRLLSIISRTWMPHAEK